MKTILMSVMMILSTQGHAQENAARYQGLVCEVEGNDHRPYHHRFEIVKEGEVFRAIHTPLYHTDSEVAAPHKFAGTFRADYVPVEDPRIVDLRHGGIQGEYQGRKGIFYNNLVTREVTVREPGCCGDYVSTSTEFQIKIRRYFSPTGDAPWTEVKEEGLDLDFHPTQCKAILED